MRLDDPRLAKLAGATRGLSAVVSFVEESADHRLFIAAALIEDGEIRHVHRKLFLPTYGLFDERRFFAAGDVLRVGPVAARGRARDRRVRGLLAPVRAAAPGARRGADPDQRLVVAGSRPGGDQRGRARDRDVVADADADLRPADDLVRGLLQPRRRRRVDLVLGRLGGHRADRRRPSSARRSTTRGCTWSTSRLADIRRERIALPLLRDERPELQVRELSRIVAERAGLAPDSTAERGAEPGLRRRCRPRSRHPTPASGRGSRRRRPMRRPARPRRASAGR